MDMESDLGIDSIKRVEILGAMQSLYPDLPKLKPEELAELRTLGQIVEHIGAKLGTHSVSTPSIIIPAVMAPPAPAVSSAPVAVATSTVDLTALTQSLMEVVSEKTGYPVETLEPAMDMESDLGIDSIKRVEILGAMQSLYPRSSQAQTGRTGGTENPWSDRRAYWRKAGNTRSRYPFRCHAYCSDATCACSCSERCTCGTFWY